MDYTITTELLEPGPQLESHRDTLWDILEATDQDFVPPLSRRRPTALGQVQPAVHNFPVPIEHVEFALKLNVIIARVDEKPVGFMSFKSDFEHASIRHQLRFAGFTPSQ